MHKHYFQLKTWLLVFLMVITAVSFSVIAVVYEFNQEIKIAQAGDMDAISGYAWSSNIGWISFNCDNNPSDCLTVDYGVDLNPATGNFSKYAWSSNIGWISFNELNPPDNYTFNVNCPNVCNTTNNCTACMKDNGVNKTIYGWAKILALGDEGWLKIVDGAAIGSDGKFTGWMWNANDTGAGIGWVSLNGANFNAGGGGYAVRTKLPGKPTITSITWPIGFSDSRLKINWDDVTGETAYKVLRDLAQAGSDLPAGSTTKEDGPLLMNTQYSYIVQACNAIGCVSSDAVSKRTNSVAQVVGTTITGTGECLNKINLTWPAAAGSDYYILSRYQNNVFIASTTVATSTPVTYKDQIMNGIALDGKLKYTYTVQGCDTSPAQCGDVSAQSKEFLPCANTPTWREVKSQ